MSWLSFIIGCAFGLIIAGGGLIIAIKWQDKNYHMIKKQEK